MPVMQKRTYYLGGEMHRLMDGVLRGQPSIKVEIDFPECVEVDDRFLEELDGLLSEICSIFQ